MIRIGLVAILLVTAFLPGCAASFAFKASAEIDVPIAEMPAKYASWVVEADGYLQAVNAAYARHQHAKAELAAGLGVEANADAIATFIRDAIKVQTKVVCQPPSFNASFVADCRADANARATGRAGSGSASSEASAGIRANCDAGASLNLTPGSCTVQTTVNQHPILSDAARWAKVEANMKIILQLSAANRHLDGRGDGINARGNQLHAESVTDLGKDPTLALQMDKIQAELRKGSDATAEANSKQRSMNSDLLTMTAAIDAQFPGLRASVNGG
ncbi:MAG: hypothetical protein SF187_05870 [Deltaproteobacteria bacterium]|nr:hypothetical protein [Deltaproteobacteria bacterium]